MMDNSENLRQELMTKDSEFRELAREHGRYEARLSELSALHFPNDKEQMEEASLKRKKLAIKDQMQAIIMRYQEKSSVVH